MEAIIAKAKEFNRTIKVGGALWYDPKTHKCHQILEGEVPPGLGSEVLVWGFGSLLSSYSYPLNFRSDRTCACAWNSSRNAL